MRNYRRALFMSHSLQKTLFKLIPGCRRYARALLGDQNSADSLIESALLPIVKSGLPWLPEHWVKHWLYRSLHKQLQSPSENLAASVQLPASAVPASEHQAAPPAATASVSAEFTEPFELPATEAMFLRMDARLSELSVPVRSVYLLSVLEEFTRNDIAKILNIPGDAVTKNFALANRQLVGATV